MDRILKAEGDTPNRYKVIKQADVLMTYYILAPEQVSTMLERMGYEPGDPRELLKKNYNYYIARCSHGSTLSYVVHASILKYLKSMRTTQWQWFMEALKSDVYDTQGGTTPEGIHCGVMAGSIDIILTSFAGINLFRDKILINPRLPSHWKEISFTMQHQGSYFDVRIDHCRVAIKARAGYDSGIAVEIRGNHIDLLDQKETKVEY
jgi:trehalose/maltose hydrolase-like predicted phosphorylase